MQNKILILAVVILIPIVVISFNKKETNFNLAQNNSVTVKLKDVDKSEVTNIDLEEYIIGVVAAEMPASFNVEALKAQAVAARTYAYHKISNTNKDYDLVSDITDQSYINKEAMREKWGNDYKYYYNKIKEAVNSTKGQIMTYKGDVIKAYYFAMSNGYTEDSALVFEEQPYLESVESKWDNDSLNNFQVDITFAKMEFCDKLSIECNKIEITDINRSSSNRVNKVTINDKVFLGTDIRNLLSLRSTDFDITITNDNVFITTYGYGHGVGMSQYGANGMASEGYSYKDILNYYYKNIDITKI
ncbi:MAG: stage II sporulation protein D [Bacilli bacterium]|nr:stage II sporulation protein D [Bacilli bacterium]